MTRTHYEVIVVGGGPAGETAAYELARRGLDVLLLEKEPLPRYKTCAGGIPLKTVQLLDLDLSSTYQAPITRGRCTYRGKSPIQMEFGKIVGWTVMRDEFDYRILSGAMKAGASVVDGQEVIEVETSPNRAYVRTAEEVYSCLAVVGADGANGVVGRSRGAHS